MDRLKRMEELVDILNRYAELYYEKDSPVVSDGEYDKLYDELKELELAENYTLPQSPTLRVGGAPSRKFKQSKHLLKLYSLDKCQNNDEFNLWCNRVVKAVGYLPELSYEYKFDGLTINLLYENGFLKKATTRGDGITGEVVTEQVKTITFLPIEISYKGLIEIQGEGILRLSQLEKYNSTAKEPLKNARNGASGAIRNLDPQVTASRGLSFIAYNIGYSEKVFHSQSDIRDFLINEGFEVEGGFGIVSKQDNAILFAEEIERKRAKLDYLIDGVVFKVNNLDLRENIGYTEKFPKWAVAYKFKADEVTTLLEDVIWQVSRSAKLNPLALLSPIDVSGVTVSRATLNNYGDIQRKGIKIGDRVFVRRSNDVIPEIMGVAETFDNSIEIEKPEKCPSCGAEVVENGAFIYCTNKECAPQIISKLSHFASKDAMDIEGFSDKTAEQLFNEKGIKTINQLLTLKKEDLFGLEGFQDKKTNNLIASIKKAKITTGERFIFSLGVDGIGKKTAKDLIKKFKSVESIMAQDIESLSLVDGIGDILAKNIYEYFFNLNNRESILEMFNNGISIIEQKTESNILVGLKFVLTGSLPTMKRGEVSKLIEDNGGEVASSISKTVNFVVAGEDAGSKLEKAEKLKIKIISESEFLEMLQ